MLRARVHSILGWTPVGLSLAAFLVVVVALATGWERGLTDEGLAAHLWQLLIVLQLPLFIAFVATAERRRRDLDVRRLGVMAGALLLALAPVAIFRL